MKYFGYVRVSTKEQNFDRQIKAIKEYCEILKIKIDDEDIYKDEKSGKDFERENYKLLKKVVREGDNIVIKELDRLGRNKEEIKKELEWFREKKIIVRILDIQTTLEDYNKYPDGIAKSMLEMVNNVLIEVLSTIAEEERRKIKQRQMEGIEIAREKGKHLGRPSVQYPNMWNEFYVQWKLKKITGKQFMEKMGLKRTTFYKMIKQYEEEKS